MSRPIPGAIKALLATLGAILFAAAALALAFFIDPLWFNDQIIRRHLRQQHVRSEYINVDGYQVHYFEAFSPAGAGTPLVLIHGLGARGEDWSALIPSLAAAGFHVYVPDLLGYGRSAKPDADYSISLQEKTVTDFMQALGLTHANVGGWSMGGWVALKLTIDHPDRVDRLVVYDSAGLYFPATFAASLFTPSDSMGLDRLFAMLTPHPQPMPAFAARAAIRRLQSNAWILNRNVDSMTAGRDLLDFQLGHIHKPTLIVWGEQDVLIPLSVGEAMHRQIPDSHLVVVQGCGHLAPSECPGPVLKATVAFLKPRPTQQASQH